MLRLANRPWLRGGDFGRAGKSTSHNRSRYPQFRGQALVVSIVEEERVSDEMRLQGEARATAKLTRNAASDGELQNGDDA